MKLTPPTKNVFWISVIIAVIGLVALFVGSFAPYAFWLMLVAYVLLALGNTMKGF